MADIALAVVGPGGVGKSALTTRYVRDIFLERYDPTIEDTLLKNIELPTKQGLKSCRVEIRDTAGQEEFAAVTQRFIQGAHGILLVYSITSEHSFSSLANWIKRITVLHDNPIPLVIVGNKCDLENERAVSSQAAKEYSKSLSQSFFEQEIPFMEVSAKNGIGVSECFFALIERCARYRDLYFTPKKEKKEKKQKDCILS